QSGLYTIQARAFLADVEAEDVFGKKLSIGISAENPNGNSDRVPGLAPFAHKRVGKTDASPSNVRCQVPSHAPKSEPFSVEKREKRASNCSWITTVGPYTTINALDINV